VRREITQRMNQVSRNAGLLLGVCIAMGICQAQDLAPRAYVITPLHSNAITLTWAFYDGNINYNGALPVSGAVGTYSVQIFSYYHSFNFFGRSANIVASLPYALGNFNGTALGAEQHLYRSGLLDSTFRFSVNLKGGPAMPVQKFMKWHQKILLGASLKVMAPTGQYDPTKLINWGTNRWSFKPEFGYSERWGKWVLDGYMGVWLFTTNNDFFSRNPFYAGTRSQSQDPIGAFEGHLSYDFKPRFWASLDGNFWFGGKTTVSGVQNPLTEQTNSRIGGTVSVPISKHQSLKFSYNNGTYIRFGGNYQNVSAAWQYSWLGKPN
jgi:Putative MetA-pathway of phenol degradation